MSRSMLGEQFSDESVKQGDYRLKHPRKRKSMSKADTVYGQLTDDYPKSALGWVHNVQWSGPKEVPLDKIEWDDARVWKAAHERSHVNAFVKKIGQEEAKGEHIKPVITVARPGKPTLMIPDGHHRAVAYKKLDEPVWAWVGKASKVTGPWDTLHDYQFKDDGAKDIYR